VIARVPRGELKAVELGRGYLAPITIIFGNGDTWRLEIPPPNKKGARAVVAALTV
jgi:hypothetical protein